MHPSKDVIDTSNKIGKFRVFSNFLEVAFRGKSCGKCTHYSKRGLIEGLGVCRKPEGFNTPVKKTNGCRFFKDR